MELSTYFRFVVALIFVLALIGLIAWAVRRFGLLRGTIRPPGGSRRLNIVEVAPLDAKRRLVLVRRDGTEHLLLLGSASELVVETGIPAGDAPPSGEAPRETP
jgi:flagellar protein FliO/FliZ